MRLFSVLKKEFTFCCRLEKREEREKSPFAKDAIPIPCYNVYIPRLWSRRPFQRADVCKKETRHYTKDTHESPVSKTRRIWCEDCRVVQMQFKQTDGKWG